MKGPKGDLEQEVDVKPGWTHERLTMQSSGLLTLGIAFAIVGFVGAGVGVLPLALGAVDSDSTAAPLVAVDIACAGLLVSGIVLIIVGALRPHPSLEAFESDERVSLGGFGLGLSPRGLTF